MPLTVTDFVTQLGYDIRRTITAQSDPTLGTVYNLIYQASEWILAYCADLKSELGRKDGSISIVKGQSSYTDFADDLYAPYHKAWITKLPPTGQSRDRVDLCSEDEVLNYDPTSTSATEPDKFYFDKNNTLTFLSIPDVAYPYFTLPYWYHQTRIKALSYPITGVDLTNPCVVHFVAGHDFGTDDRMWVDGTSVGATELQNRWFTVTNSSSTSVTLQGIDATGYSAWTSGGNGLTVLPFNGVFDTIFLKYCGLSILVGDEYQVPIEQAWFQFLLNQVKRTIMMRRNPVSKVSR